ARRRRPHGSGRAAARTALAATGAGATARSIVPRALALRRAGPSRGPPAVLTGRRARPGLSRPGTLRRRAARTRRRPGGAARAGRLLRGARGARLSCHTPQASRTRPTIPIRNTGRDAPHTRPHAVSPAHRPADGVRTG